jgi:phosphatidylglycerophosphatase A
VAPGTVGTLGAVPLWWALSALPRPVLPIAIVLLGLVGVAAARRAGQYWGVVDASAIVVDEVVGYLVTVSLVPFSWPTAAAGFVLFRLFDVAKPWPVSVFDRIKSAWGVMLDDVAAGLYAMAILAAVIRWLPGAP